MDQRLRDALLALTTCTLLVAISIRAGFASSFARPLPFLVGVVGALTIEWLSLRHRDRVRAVWERSTVQGATVVLVVLLGWVAATANVGSVVLPALVWGLLTYLLVLAFVVAGTGTPLVGKN